MPSVGLQVTEHAPYTFGLIRTTFLQSNSTSLYRDTLPRLARGERQLWDGWSQLPWNLVPAGDQQHSTEMTQKAWGQAQPEQRESLQAWAASLKVRVSSWCEGRRQGRRQGRRLGRRANDVPNLTSCTAAVVKHKEEAAWKGSPLGLTTLATV